MTDDLSVDSGGALESEAPFFSVVTVSLNSGDVIGRTIQSLARQTFRDFEYIIVDGGSTDGTLDLLKRYDGLITQLLVERDNGIYDAMNKAVRLARGRYLYFLNAGDELAERDVLRNVHSYCSGDPAGVVFGDVILVDLEGPDQLLEYEGVTGRFLYRTALCHQATFTARSAFEAIGPFDTSYRVCADHEWFTRAFFRTNVRFAHMSAPIARFHRGGLSDVRDAAFWRERNAIAKAHIPRSNSQYYRVRERLANIRAHIRLRTRLVTASRRLGISPRESTR